MNSLPLFHNLDGKRCLLVGGGRIGIRRAESMMNAGARVDLVAPDIDPALADRVTRAGGSVLRRPWEENDLQRDHALAVAATNDKQLNLRIADRARELRVPVNVVTDSSASDVTFPGVVERQPFTIAISSGSASPLLARLLRERINALIPDGYGQLAELVGRYRQAVRERFTSVEVRKRFWEKALTGNVAERVFAGNIESAQALLEHDLAQTLESDPGGEVYLIGAGPGDPDLLTFRAWRLLQQSEVVLYDRLVSQRILDLINPDAEMIYVGKQRANHSVPQDEINQLLVRHARAGKRVARLKGGDPFIFGRGGEEIDLLADNRVTFQVVPGITAASGCASYSGIPLTHRDHAQSVRFVTGQLRDGTVDLPWEQLVQPGQTVVIYMGLNGLPQIAAGLTGAGMDGDTPVALIEQGTTARQRVHISTIDALPGEVKRLVIRPPTLLIIGSVVRLHHKLSWFEPLEPAEGTAGEEAGTASPA